MFHEFACGCIVSRFQGRVRICPAHRPAKATGDGALASTDLLRYVVARYPANGEGLDTQNG